uniref:Uncharacterized protein n=1 Tax=Riboviria sp. TaxID=2585031 RepID=A0A8K1U2M9_9VIRU|nr:MAG: hypothetical protein 1 [Riboviria sp.]
MSTENVHIVNEGGLNNPEARPTVDADGGAQAPTNVDRGAAEQLVNIMRNIQHYVERVHQAVPAPLQDRQEDTGIIAQVRATCKWACCVSVISILLACGGYAIWYMYDSLLIRLVRALVLMIWRACSSRVEKISNHVEEIINPPPIPPTTLEIIMENIVLYSDKILAVGLLMLLGYIVIAVSAATLLVPLMRKVFLTITCYRLGISRKRQGIVDLTYRPEAMLPNSSFRETGMEPNYQVAIWDPESQYQTTDRFLGYGLRFGDTLVVPIHVLAHIKEDMMLVKENRKVLITKPQHIESQFNSDCGYLPLTQNIWAQIGVSKMPRGLPSTRTINVSVTGTPGTSTGLLRQSNIPSIVYYSGSTTSGMSGAAYYVGGVCYGMHTGALPTTNMGISSLLFMTELTHMYPESGPEIDNPIKVNAPTSWDADTFKRKPTQEEQDETDELWFSLVDKSRQECSQEEIKVIKQLASMDMDTQKRLMKMVEMIRDCADRKVTATTSNVSFIAHSGVGATASVRALTSPARKITGGFGDIIQGLQSDVALLRVDLENERRDSALRLREATANFEKQLEEHKKWAELEISLLTANQAGSSVPTAAIQQNTDAISEVHEEVDELERTHKQLQEEFKKLKVQTEENYAGIASQRERSALMSERVRVLAGESCTQAINPEKGYYDHQCDLCVKGHTKYTDHVAHLKKVHNVTRTKMVPLAGRDMQPSCAVYHHLGGDLNNVVPDPKTTALMNPESAYSSDTKRVISQTPFLGEKKSSKKRRQKRSKKSSSSPVTTKQSQSLEGIQSSIQKLTDFVDQFSGNSQPTTAGQTSAVRQN